MKSPFFATLALFAQFVPTERLSTAATDGKDIFFNPDFLRSLPPPQIDGILLHEVLHAALLHVPRRGIRDAEVWNCAADIVVNGTIDQQSGFELPTDVLRDRKLEHLSVEEVYELLLKNGQKLICPNLDLLSQSPGTEQESHSAQTSDRFSAAQTAALEAHWRNALQQATVIARSTQQGSLPAGIDREFGLLTTPQLDWRSYLWRYLVQTPTDFQGFDRRFVHQGLYLESLAGESVHVFVAVDTSGSIGQAELRSFLSEVQGILAAYPHLRCLLYYVDAAAYGPYELDLQRDLPKPEGGGGTSFVPFFEAIDQQWDGQTPAVCVYLTDGYGAFPTKPPQLPVLWVVTAGGLALEQFPFGEGVRLLSTGLVQE